MADSQLQGITAGKRKRSTFEPYKFGRYYLVDKLSKGGMSDIYLAKMVGESGFQKPLVIKKLLPRYREKPRYVKRFLNEAKTLAQLNHSNIVQVLDMGAEDGEYYIALEYIEGRNVAHVISKAQKNSIMPSLEFSLYLVTEVAKGLAYSHRKTSVTGDNLMLVHQDVNSFNLMVSYEAEVKIIDFGIARIFLDQEDEDELPVAGKLLYFSPEQLQGKEVDRRVDIYGAGVLLYELCTGERLFEHKETVSETVKNILETDVSEIIRKDDRIHSEVKPILIKATALDPRDRYSWMEEMIEHIRSVITRCSLDVDTQAFSNYLKAQFEKEILIDNRRMRKLLEDELPTKTKSPPRKSRSPRQTAPRAQDLSAVLAEHFPEAFRKKRDRSAAARESGPRLVEVRAQKIVFRDTDPGNYVYIIQAGRVRLFVNVGGESRTLAILGKGDFFGESALLGAENRCMSAEALDDCTLFCMEKDVLLDLLDRELPRQLVVALSKRLQSSFHQLAGNLLEDPLSRFIFMILALHRYQSISGDPKIEMRTIKDHFGDDDSDQIRKYVTKLESLDVVDVNTDGLIVKDAEKLENIFKVLSGGGPFSLKL